MEKIKPRPAAVAGQFYPSSATDIKKLLEQFIDKNITAEDAISCMMPHAGYIYSGRVAAQTAASVKIKDTVILLGPNHTGYGSDFSIMTQGIWHTPMGNVEINQSLATKILQNNNNLSDDSLAHMYEHSLEVELPVLQYFKNNFKIVPIAVLSDNFTKIKKLGESIANTIIDNRLKDSVTIIASTDMTHYEPEDIANQKDSIAIKAILELDENKLINEIRRLNITMCGYAPTIAVICASKALGAMAARLIKYETSAVATGDKTSVVGYAGIVIS